MAEIATTLQGIMGAFSKSWMWILVLIVAWYLWKRSQRRKVELPIINTREVVQLNNLDEAEGILKAYGWESDRKLYYNGHYIGKGLKETIVEWRPDPDAEPKRYLLIKVKKALLGKERFYILDLDAIEDVGEGITVIKAPLDEFAGIYYTMTRDESGTSTRDVIIDWSYKRILEGELGAMEELAKHVATYHDSYMAAKILEAELMGEALSEAQREKRARKAFGL